MVHGILVQMAGRGRLAGLAATAHHYRIHETGPADGWRGGASQLKGARHGEGIHRRVEIIAAAQARRGQAPSQTGPSDGPGRGG